MENQKKKLGNVPSTYKSKAWTYFGINGDGKDYYNIFS